MTSVSLESDEFEFDVRVDGKIIWKKLQLFKRPWVIVLPNNTAAGYKWGITVKSKRDCIGVFLRCCDNDNVTASFKLDVTSYIKDQDVDINFSTQSTLACSKWKKGLGFPNIMRIEELSNLQERVLDIKFKVTIFVEKVVKRINNRPYMNLGISIRENIDSDFIIVLSDDSVLQAHTTVLKAASPVFKAMLEHNVRESLDGKLTIDDFDPEIVRIFIESFYTGLIPPDCDFKRMFAISDKYKVEALAKKCLSELVSSVTVENACFLLGSMKRCNYFKGMPEEVKVSQFIHDHYEEIEDTEDFQALSKDPVFLLSILQRRGKKRKREDS